MPKRPRSKKDDETAALQEAKDMYRETYRYNVKRVWELQEFDPDLPVKRVAERLNISIYSVQKILKHDYQKWYIDELRKQSENI